MPDLWSARISAQQSRQHISYGTAIIVGLIFLAICVAAWAMSAGQ